MNRSQAFTISGLISAVIIIAALRSIPDVRGPQLDIALIGRSPDFHEHDMPRYQIGLTNKSRRTMEFKVGPTRPFADRTNTSLIRTAWMGSQIVYLSPMTGTNLIVEVTPFERDFPWTVTVASRRRIGKVEQVSRWLLFKIGIGRQLPVWEEVGNLQIKQPPSGF